MSIQLITPFLWFDREAEEAAKFYVSIFPNSKIVKVLHYGEGAPAPAGSVMTVDFELDGQPFVALNAGPHVKFNEAVSFMVTCETQADVDHYWEKLTAGGSEMQCGWLKDKFGLSWQVTPKGLVDLMGGPDPVKSGRAMAAMCQMKKLDIHALRKAYENASE